MYTVRTQTETDLCYRIGYYLQKEAKKTVVLCENYDLKNYADMWSSRQSLAARVSKTPSYKCHSINELPHAYLNYCDANKLDWRLYKKNFTLMAREGEITVTQLRHLNDVCTMISVLKGAELPEYLFSDILI
jgi:hypothetical protein